MATVSDAIEAYEQATGLHVTIHDLDNCLWRELPESRFRHSRPRCVEIKLGTGGHKCVRFEVDQFRSDYGRWPDGRTHRCHAGITEVVAPVVEDNRLRFVLFAGPLKLARDESLDLDEYRPSNAPSMTSIDYDRGSARQSARVARLLLLQLGARVAKLTPHSVWHQHPHDQSREAIIRRYMGANYGRQIALADLADHLNLSPDRTRHIIKERFGTSFRELLRGYRIDAARGLLLNSGLQVAEIVERCGFASQSSFARVFAQRYGQPPGRWRRINQG